MYIGKFYFVMLFLWEVYADLNDPYLCSAGYVYSRYPLKIITWLLFLLNTGAAGTQQPGQPALLAQAGHDREGAWNVYRNNTQEWAPDISVLWFFPCNFAFHI